MNEQLLFIVAGLVAGMALFSWYSKLRKRHRLVKISQRAQKGEAKAEKLLEREGYTVLSSQERRSVTMIVDGEPHESFVRADYIVSKRGKTYLAEVKTGKQANVLLPNVRRQLYEYQNIFDTDGILFLDMNKYAIIEVAFTRSNAPSPDLKYFISGVFVGVCLTIFIFSYY